MEFVSFCMSPAIDGTVVLPAAPRGEGEIFKDVAETETVGGKGLNVARWLAIRGARVSCSGLLGSDNAFLFARELARYGIADGFVRVSGATRKNEMIVWPGGSMKINRPAFADVREMPAFGRVVRPGGVAILSGSLPKHCPVDFYATLAAELKQGGMTVVLDASEAPLVEGVKAHPDWIKPNDAECAALIGYVPQTPDDFTRAAADLRAFASHSLISAGAAGCWVDGVFVPAPKAASVLDTTAAGDTLLAEFCFRHFEQGLVPDEAARWAVAAGTASVRHPGAEPPNAEEVAALYASVARS